MSQMWIIDFEYRKVQISRRQNHFFLRDDKWKGIARYEFERGMDE